MIDEFKGEFKFKVGNKTIVYRYDPKYGKTGFSIIVNQGNSTFKIGGFTEKGEPVRIHHELRDQYGRYHTCQEWILKKHGKEKLYEKFEYVGNEDKWVITCKKCKTKIIVYKPFAIQ